MIHLLSQVIERNFHGHQILLEPDNGKSTKKKIKVYSSGRANNFGKVLEKLDYYLPKIYTIIDGSGPNSEDKAMISNSNRKDIMCWYIDMDHKFTLKENLPLVSKYAITSKDHHGGRNSLWISKPSHPYIGSGKYIIIGSKKKVESRPDVIHDGEPLKWVVQPLLTNVILWFDRFKFDIRTYAIVYNIEDNFYGACYRMGICRRSIKDHNPTKNPTSAITNISIQEKIPGYDAEFHMPMIYDDLKIGCNILEELIKNSGLRRDHRKKLQFYILGMDILFLDDGTPKLIEVNTDPYFEVKDDVKAENNEKMVSTGFILGAFGHILPNLLEGKNIRELDDWDFC